MTAKILAAAIADENHQVLSVTGGSKTHMKKPCPDCPWRKDAVGEFPAEAFRISAKTSYDMAQSTFACHQAGAENPRTCAGFLLSESAHHNMQVRLEKMRGVDYRDVSSGGAELFDTYAEMAIANGVDPDDPILEGCR